MVDEATVNVDVISYAELVPDSQASADAGGDHLVMRDDAGRTFGLDIDAALEVIRRVRG